MKLYLKPEDKTGRGKRIFLMERNGMRRVLRGGRPVEIWLFNNKPVEVNQKDGDQFIKQDPHLVTDQMPDFSKPFPTTLDEFKDKLSGAESDLEAALKDINNHDKQIAEKDEEVNRLHEALDKARTTIQELKQSIATLEDRNASLAKQADAQAKEIESKAKEIAKLKGQAKG